MTPSHRVESFGGTSTSAVRIEGSGSFCHPRIKYCNSVFATSKTPLVSPTLWSCPVSSGGATAVCKCTPFL